MRVGLPRSADVAIRPARPGRTCPSARREHLRQQGSETTRLEHLTPSCAKSEPPCRGGDDVAVQVVPAIKRQLVAEPAVELEKQPLLDVLHVALDRTRGRPLRSLAPAPRQTVSTFDVHQEAPLHHGEGARRDILDDREEQSSSRQPWRGAKLVGETRRRGAPALTAVGQHSHGTCRRSAQRLPPEPGRAQCGPVGVTGSSAPRGRSASTAGPARPDGLPAFGRARPRRQCCRRRHARARRALAVRTSRRVLLGRRTARAAPRTFDAQVSGPVWSA